MGKLKAFIERNSNFTEFPMWQLLQEELIQAIEAQKRKKKRVWLFCAATEENIGDDALTFAATKLLEEKTKRKPIVSSRETYWTSQELIANAVQPQDEIYIAGGGFLGSIWPEMQETVTHIISTFPKNKIIILPQSIQWPEPTEPIKQASQKAYKKCAQLMLFARDKKSKKIMEETYPTTTIKLTEDLVLAFDWSPYVTSHKERTGCLLCFRGDKEKALSAQNEEKIKRWTQQHYTKIRIEDNAPLGMQLQNWQLEELMRLKLDQFAKSELVITDRLHGMLFAAITNTPCVVFQNANHKILEVYNQIQATKPVALASNVEELANAITHVLG